MCYTILFNISPSSKYLKFHLKIPYNNINEICFGALELNTDPDSYIDCKARDRWRNSFNLYLYNHYEIYKR